MGRRSSGDFLRALDYLESLCLKLNLLQLRGNPEAAVFVLAR